MTPTPARTSETPSAEPAAPHEAVTAYRMAVELNPKDADAHNNLGAALQESGQTHDAEHALRTALSIKPDHPDAHWNLGLALLSLGRWQEGWVEYEWRRHLREDRSQNRNFPQPIWQGSPLTGMHLLVLCEQGLGDSIPFIRYVPLLVQRGARVTIECPPRLLPFFKSLENDHIKVIARELATCNQQPATPSRNSQLTTRNLQPATSPKNRHNSLFIVQTLAHISFLPTAITSRLPNP